MTGLLLYVALALADETPDPPAEETEEPAPPPDPTTPILDPEADEPHPPRWGGIVIPLVTYNSTDGLAIGLGGEIFERPDNGSGYLRKFTFQGLISIDGKYTSNMIRYDTRTGRYDVLAEIGFKAWKSHVYAGRGGDDVAIDWDAAETDNRALSPYVTVGVTQPLGPGLLYQQALLRYVNVVPHEGGILDVEAPTGLLGGWYFDVTGGWYFDRYDRWPLPEDGWHLEVDGRLGGAVVDDKEGFLPQAGVHGEATRWWPVSAPWFVVGTRVTAAWAFGDRPFFEEEFIGGRRRIEIGYDKAFVGYGRTRTRAQGVVAALVESRLFFYKTKHKFFDVGFYASLFAEEGWLLTQEGTGPHMPTIGGGPVFLWQGAVMLRPFIAWGWRAESELEPRKAMPQFGLTLTDPL